MPEPQSIPGTETSSRTQDSSVEVYTPTPADRRALIAGPQTKTQKRRKTTPRKDLQDLLKGVDPAAVGHPCTSTPILPEVQTLNAEYADLFPAELPPGLPPSRSTDHRIDFTPNSRIPAPRMYRLAPTEDAELQKQLHYLPEREYIKEVTLPFGSGILFVPKSNG